MAKYKNDSYCLRDVAPLTMNPVTIEKNQDRLYSNRGLGGCSWHVKKNPSAIAHEKKHAAVHTYAGRGLGEKGGETKLKGRNTDEVEPSSLEGKIKGNSRRDPLGKGHRCAHRIKPVDLSISNNSRLVAQGISKNQAYSTQRTVLDHRTRYVLWTSCTLELHFMFPIFLRLSS
jgi:hypothetical protein